MASRKPLVNVAGALSEVPSGDSLTVAGIIESTSGGIKFPDASIQTTAYTGGGGGGSVTTGVVEADFGAVGTAGTSEVSIVVTGQTGITNTKSLNARIELAATSNHTIEDHRYAATFLGVSVGDIVDSVGFTIYVRTLHLMTGKFNIRWTWQ